MVDRMVDRNLICFPSEKDDMPVGKDPTKTMKVVISQEDTMTFVFVAKRMSEIGSRQSYCYNLLKNRIERTRCKQLSFDRCKG
jgi:hypothetical protein